MGKGIKTKVRANLTPHKDGNPVLKQRDAKKENLEKFKKKVMGKGEYAESV